jgi:cell division protein WhiA
VTSEDVREELARIAPGRECDRLAELSALFHSAGSLHLRGKGEWALHLDLGSGAAARRAFSLLRDVGIRSEIRTYRRRAFDGATRY